MAATLTMATTAAVLAAPPGSPFYNARLYIEVALMPPVANIDARLAAYEEQFAQRIREAEAAIDRGDESALAAALAAYQNEVTNAVAEFGTNAAHLTHLQDVLATHIAKLEALAAKLPTAVARQNAIEHAIQASEKAVAKIKEIRDKNAHENGRPSNPPGLESPPPNRP
jgi:chromosome segregation ATPase